MGIPRPAHAWSRPRAHSRPAWLPGFRSTARTAGTALLLASSLSRPLASQTYPVTTIAERDRCTECSVIITRGPTFGTDSGDGMVESSGSVVSQDSRGRFYVVGNYPTEVKVYDSNGRFLRTIGRSGEGPGEFMGIAKVIATPGDSLVVLDQVQARYSILDPHYRFIRSGRLPFGPEYQSLRLPDGTFVFSLPLHTPERIGLPLHHVDQSGTIKRSFGSETGVYRPDVPYLDRRSISPHGSRTIWSAYHTQYVIDQLDVVTGRIIRRVERRTSWFPPNLRPRTGPRDPDRPEPFLSRVAQGPDGLLWVQLIVPDPDWKDALGTRSADNPVHVSIADIDGYEDTIIEVLDPGTGRLMASHRFDRSLTLFGPGFVGGVTVAEDGHVRLETWRMTLSRAGGKR
jgi:hypothetical protein